MNYTNWANKQVQMYQDRFDAKLADYMRHGGDCSPAALMRFADTSQHYQLQGETK